VLGETVESTWWDFQSHASWNRVARHYPGNFAPQVARNLITLYTKPGETVLDPFCGSGTSLVEASLLGRTAIGVDLSTRAIRFSRASLALVCQMTYPIPKLVRADARNLNFINNDSIDLVILHPPYSTIVRYDRSDSRDLSNLHSIQSYADSLGAVMSEAYRVLKSGRICALLIGDVRREGLYYPLSMIALCVGLRAGFVLIEEIVKHQINCKSDAGWRNRPHNFLMIAHEHLYVLFKPRSPKQWGEFMRDVGLTQQIINPTP